MLRESNKLLIKSHHLFLGPAQDIDDMAEAIRKVQRCAGDLKIDALKKKAKQGARRLLDGLRQWHRAAQRPTAGAEPAA